LSSVVVPHIESLKSKTGERCATPKKNLTHLQRVLLFKDSSTSPVFTGGHGVAMPSEFHQSPRRRLNGGSSKPDCQLTIRLTHSGRPASRIFWKMTEFWKPPSASLAALIAGLRNSMTVAARRCFSRIWRGFGINKRVKVPK
jgi:hypothetical protein